MFSKLLAFLVIYMILKCEGYNYNEPIVELTADNFDETIKTNNFFILFSYARWVVIATCLFLAQITCIFSCSACSSIGKTWRQLAAIYNKQENSPVKIAMVGCNTALERPICLRYDSSLKNRFAWFKDGEKIEDYFGPQTLDELKEYVEFHIPKDDHNEEL